MMTKSSRIAPILEVLLLLSLSWSEAFYLGPNAIPNHYCLRRISRWKVLRGNNNPNDNRDDDAMVYPLIPDEHVVVDQNLQRPPVNLRRESILFGDNPATIQNNNTRKLWRLCKTRLPTLVTGARASNKAMGDDNPLGAISNMIFVRLPTLVAGILYTKNELQGHPLIVDFGGGPFEMSPVAVFFVFYLILR